MATAILDILDPDVWPVIDGWAAQTVFGKSPLATARTGTRRTPGTWRPKGQDAGVRTCRYMNWM
jgi:hypothetical protein